MRFTLFYNPEQSKAELIERLILKPWADYCLRNWLNDSRQGKNAPERRVKSLLDRCGTLLLRDVPPGERNTLTSYKEMAVGSRELNLSDCPEVVAQMFEGGEIDLSRLSADDRLRYRTLTERVDARVGPPLISRKKRQSTRFDRLEAIRRNHPGCKMESCRVDVDGAFSFDGRDYRVDSTRGKYAPHKTRYGDQYDMDRIIGIRCLDGAVCFADQDGYEVEDEMIEAQEKASP